MPTPADQFVYDVTTFASPSGTDPAADIGKVIVEILADVDSKQTSTLTRPGAVIYIPPGDWVTVTQVVITQSHIQIKGSGNGWLSKEVRDYNAGGGIGWRELRPGSSHIILQTPKDAAAFRINRSATLGRVSGVEFRDFCIDGSDKWVNPTEGENPRPHGIDTVLIPARIAIAADSDTDAVRIEGMSFMYMHTAIALHGADAAFITNNVIGECASGVELWVAANSRITNNSIWCDGYTGAITVYGGSSAPGESILIQGNTIDNYGRIRLSNTNGAAVIGNKINTWWAWAIQIDASNDCFVSSNYVWRRTNDDRPPQSNPVRDDGSPVTDDLGLISVKGDRNTVSGNFVSSSLGGTNPGIRVLSGYYNFLMSNRISTNNGGYGALQVDGGAVGTRVIYSAQTAQLADSGSGTLSVPTP